MAYELGNEVNLYGTLFRPAGYDAKAYAAQMHDWLPRLYARSPRNVKFQFPSFAGPPQDFNSDLTIAELVKLGVPQSIPGIEYMSVHGYPYNICSGMSLFAPVYDQDSMLICSPRCSRRCCKGQSY